MPPDVTFRTEHMEGRPTGQLQSVRRINNNCANAGVNLIIAGKHSVAVLAYKALKEPPT